MADQIQVGEKSGTLTIVKWLGYHTVRKTSGEFHRYLPIEALWGAV